MHIIITAYVRKQYIQWENGVREMSSIKGRDAFKKFLLKYNIHMEK